MCFSNGTCRVYIVLTRLLAFDTRSGLAAIVFFLWDSDRSGIVKRDLILGGKDRKTQKVSGFWGESVFL